MAVKPVVRYMVLCNDWFADPANGLRINIVGLVTNVHSHTQGYPLVLRELCVFLMLTEGYGRSDVKIVVIDESTGEVVFESRPRLITFGNDPLEVTGLPFRLRDLTFRKSGLYAVQFWYDGEVVEERPIRVR